jgi:protein-S-isoprenylcysteine O-methyltransferase Ste14
VFPLIYSVTDWLGFADYTLPALAGWLGGCPGSGFAAAVRLGPPRPEEELVAFLKIVEGHKLITSGIYKYIQHPMYASQFVVTFAQILLLQNWIAGPLGLVCFIPFYFVRVIEEEKLMLETFGDEYRKYKEKTGGLFPKIG